MATNVLTCGPVHTVAQNVSVGLPAGLACRVRASGAIESSLDESAWAAVTLTNNEAEVSAPFIRPTGVGNTLIRISKV
jgi:hypothetical protein